MEEVTDECCCKIKLEDTAVVDGEVWHTVQCTTEVSIWLRSQPGEDRLWFQNIDERWMTNHNTFDVHPTVYTMLCLRWS